MDNKVIQIQIEQNKEQIHKALLQYQTLVQKYGTDHDETIKQRQQIGELFDKFNILFNKIGNGWSGKVQQNIEEMKERIVTAEKNNIELKASIAALDTKLDIVITDLLQIKNRPRNALLRTKDIIYIAVALTGIIGFLLTYFGV